MQCLFKQTIPVHRIRIDWVIDVCLFDVYSFTSRFFWKLWKETQIIDYISIKEDVTMICKACQSNRGHDLSNHSWPCPLSIGLQIQILVILDKPTPDRPCGPQWWCLVLLIMMVQWPCCMTKITLASHYPALCHCQEAAASSQSQSSRRISFA